MSPSRHLAISTVANPGVDDSRVAFHTFEIEATPHLATDALPPDELLLNWPTSPPNGTVVRIYLSTWRAQDVVDLADRLYPRHDIEVADAHTIELPAGGSRYVPIRQSVIRQNGVLAVEFPLGICKGQRFDLSVRQVANKRRQAQVPGPEVKKISIDEAQQLLATLDPPPPAGSKGVFPLGDNKVLVTDLSIFDDADDHALVIRHPAPAAMRAAQLDSVQWRETIGAFQLGVPVSTQAEMLVHQIQLLSIMRWRAAQLDRRSRWRRTMQRYVDLLGAKVQALGGNPWTVPATPDGVVPPGSGTFGVGGVNALDWWRDLTNLLRGPLGCGLLILAALLLILLLWLFLHH